MRSLQPRHLRPRFRTPWSSRPLDRPGLKGCSIHRASPSAAFDPLDRIEGDTMVESGELQLAQEDGEPPTFLAAGSVPGESGISILRVRFKDAVHLSGTLRHHLVCFVSPVLINCRMAD